jgi:hypothetical protein
MVVHTFSSNIQEVDLCEFEDIFITEWDPVSKHKLGERCLSSTDSSCREPKFSSQHPQGGSQPSLTVPGNLSINRVRILWSENSQRAPSTHVLYIRTNKQNIHTHKIKTNKIIYFKVVSKYILLESHRKMLSLNTSVLLKTMLHTLLIWGPVPFMKACLRGSVMSPTYTGTA